MAGQRQGLAKRSELTMWSGARLTKACPIRQGEVQGARALTEIAAARAAYHLVLTVGIGGRLEYNWTPNLGYGMTSGLAIENRHPPDPW